MAAAGRRQIILWCGALALPFFACAGQQYEEMSESVRWSLRQQILSPVLSYPPILVFSTEEEGQRWLDSMSERLAKILPSRSVLQDEEMRRDFLTAVHYEATRAGIDPQLMLAVMHVESAFRKYAISIAGARGLMQVMPFWTKEIGDNDARQLFQLRANLRYGAVILRHYLDIEKGDLTRALARYNGSLGSAKYPNLVYEKLSKHWQWRPQG